MPGAAVRKDQNQACCYFSGFDRLGTHTCHVLDILTFGPGVVIESPSVQHAPSEFYCAGRCKVKNEISLCSKRQRSAHAHRSDPSHCQRVAICYLLSSFPPFRPLARLSPPCLDPCLASSIRSHPDVIKDPLGSLVGRRQD